MQYNQSSQLDDQADSEETGQVNNFVALRNLKQKQLETIMLKNRIKVLEAHNEHTNKKILNNKQKLEELASIRQVIAKQNSQIQSFKKTRQNQLQTKSIYNKENKSLHADIMSKNREDINLKKLDNHSFVKKQQKKNEKKIHEERQKSKQQKVKKHQKVVSEESESRVLISEYLSRKNNTVHDQLAKEKENIYRKQILKEKQLNNLAKKELQLVKKHSQSEGAYKQMKNKLDVMLGKIRQEKKRKKQTVLGSNNTNNKNEQIKNCDEQP